MMKCFMDFFLLRYERGVFWHIYSSSILCMPHVAPVTLTGGIKIFLGNDSDKLITWWKRQIFLVMNRTAFRKITKRDLFIFCNEKENLWSLEFNWIFWHSSCCMKKGNTNAKHSCLINASWIKSGFDFNTYGWQKNPSPNGFAYLLPNSVVMCVTPRSWWHRTRKVITQLFITESGSYWLIGSFDASHM